MRRFNLFNTNYSLISYFLLLIILTFLAIACNRQMNESAETETPDKNKTALNNKILNIDTVYEEKYGYTFMKIKNPDPLIEYITFSENNYFKVVFKQEAMDGYWIKPKAIESFKMLIDFNEKHETLEIDKNGNVQIFHKGIRVANFKSQKYRRKIEGKYRNDLDINIDNLISKQQAIQIAKTEAVNTGFEFMNRLELEERIEYLKNFNKKAINYFKNIDTTAHLFIRKYDNVDNYLPYYGYLLFSKSPYESDKYFVVNAQTGNIQKIKDLNVNICQNCTASSIDSTDCAITHKVNFDYSTIVAEGVSCTPAASGFYKFENFPNVFKGCDTIESSFFKCNNFDPDGSGLQPSTTAVPLTSSDGKITAGEFVGSKIRTEFISLDNTSYNEIELQQLTAFKNTEISYNYFQSSVNLPSLFSIELKDLSISAGYWAANNAAAGLTAKTLNFGNAITSTCKPFVSLNIVAHEFTHLVLYNYFDVLGMDLPSDIHPESEALHEALSDIMSMLIVYNDTKTYDWSIIDELNCNIVRFFNDPTMSIPEQISSYNFVETTDDEYYWAGIITYWFYLLTDPNYEVVNDLIIGNGIGAIRAEQLMFATLEKIKESISADLNPIDNMSFDGNVVFEEFRDVVLASANELFNFNNPDYNLCSPEYTKAYLAFKAVGLIDDMVTPPCNIITYNEFLTENCPDAYQYFCSEQSDGIWSFTSGFPSNFNNPFDNYWIQVAVDKNNNDIFEINEFIEDDEAFTNDILNHIITVDNLPSDDTNVRLIITNVTDLKNGVVLGEVSLPSVQYIFSCNNGCNLITDINTGYVNETPPVNTGNISINVEKDIEICAGSNFCIDYEVNAPAFVKATINSDKFTKRITQSGTTNIGQFCWQPSIDDLGIYNFSILASDEHPVEPLFNTETINVNVKTYSTFGCGCAGTYPAETVNFDNAIASGHYVALENLESSGNLYSSANVIFKGGESVSLNKGFYAPASTNFEAYIANCPVFPIPNSEDP